MNQKNDEDWSKEYFIDHVGSMDSTLQLALNALAQLCVNCGGEISVPMIANAPYPFGEYTMRGRVWNGSYQFKIFPREVAAPENPEDRIEG